MSRRSKITTDVPQAIQEEFNAKLVKNNFSNYQGLTTWLNQELAKQGLELRVGKSSVARYGSDFQSEFEARMKETNQLFQIAKVAKQQNEDVEGLLREVAILQSNGNLLRLLNEVRNAEEDGAAIDVVVDLNVKITSALANMGRLDIQSRKYQDEIRKQALTEFNEALESSEQLDKKTLASVRAEILEKILGNAAKKS
jgi:hypothetical protein